MTNIFRVLLGQGTFSPQNSANLILLSEVILGDNYPASANISFFGLFGIGCQDSASRWYIYTLGQNNFWSNIFIIFCHIRFHEIITQNWYYESKCMWVRELFSKNYFTTLQCGVYGFLRTSEQSTQVPMFLYGTRVVSTIVDLLFIESFKSYVQTRRDGYFSVHKVLISTNVFG